MVPRFLTSKSSQHGTWKRNEPLFLGCQSFGVVYYYRTTQSKLTYKKKKLEILLAKYKYERISL